MKTLVKAGKIALPVLFLLVLIIGMIQIRPSKAIPLESFHAEWVLIRDTADEDGASFAAVYDLTGVGITSSSFGNFASKDTSSVANGGAYQISPREGANNRMMFVFCAKNYNNVDDIFSFNVVGWSRENGMLQNIAEGDCVIGTQAVVIYPDGGDALGELVSETSVSYDDAGGAQDNYFTVTNEAFADVAVGMLARVTGTNITSGIYQVTIVTDSNNIKIAVTGTDDNTDSTVQINPAFWVDTINLDETTKWSASGADPCSLTVINSGDNEVAGLVINVAGLDWIQFVVYVADAATSEEAGAVTVYGRKY